MIDTDCTHDLTYDIITDWSHYF